MRQALELIWLRIKPIVQTLTEHNRERVYTEPIKKLHLFGLSQFLPDPNWRMQTGSQPMYER